MSSAHEPSDPPGHGSGRGRSRRIRAIGDYSPGNLLRLLAVGAGTGGGMLLFLDMMFHLHRETPPAGLDGLAPLGLAALTLGIVSLFAWDGPLSRAGRERARHGGRIPNRRALQKIQRDFAEARRRRLAAMADDPILARYVPRIEAGEHWTDEQIAYDIDPSPGATCEHLRPVESALHAADVPVKLSIAHWIMAKAICDLEALHRRFTLPPSVSYAEGYTSDRGSDYEPYAYLRCRLCESRIDFLHRDEAKRDAPVFPSA